MNRNAAEFTDVVRRAEYVEAPVIEEPAGPRQQARDKQVADGYAAAGAGIDNAVVRRRQCDARLAYALLAVVLLLTAWFAIAINNSLDEINAQLERTPVTIAFPLSN
jgi:hypothetical protein